MAIQSNQPNVTAASLVRRALPAKRESASVLWDKMPVQGLASIFRPTKPIVEAAKKPVQPTKAAKQALVKKPPPTIVKQARPIVAVNARIPRQAQHTAEAVGQPVQRARSAKREAAKTRK